MVVSESPHLGVGLIQVGRRWPSNRIPTPTSNVAMTTIPVVEFVPVRGNS